MKVLLLRSFFALEKSNFPATVNEPLGLESVAAFLRGNHSVEILDAVSEGWNQYWQLASYPKVIFLGLSVREIIKRIKKSSPDVVGVTWLFSTQNDAVNIIIKEIRKNFPQIKIVVGGPYPSTNPVETLEKNFAIDVVVCGEGEITLKKILDNKLEKLEEIQGIAFRRRNQIIVNSPRERIQNLNALPIPDRSLVKYNNYAKQFLFVFVYTRLKSLGLNPPLLMKMSRVISNILFLDKIYYFLHNLKSANEYLPKADIVTSRGCPNFCSFCAIHNIWGHVWRGRSADGVLAEIDELIKKYKVKHINIQDDNFNISKSRVIEICKKIIERGYEITLSANSGTYIPTLDEEVLMWLHQAGFKYLRFSIESGSQEVLDKIIKKKIDLSQIKGIVVACRRIGLKTEGAFIFGVPGESIDTMEQTTKFANEMGFDNIKKFIFQPFPNTELFDVCARKGYFTSNYDQREVYVTGDKCFVKTEKFSPEDVINIARRK